MSRAVDVIIVGGLGLLCFSAVAVLGLYHPHTIAGAIARFVWGTV